MIPEKIKAYLLNDMEATPDLLVLLVPDVTDPAVYDRRPDPSRFTLREILAHLADWEPIFQHRFERTRREDNPTLEDIDEGVLAITHDYAQADPAECLRRFRAGREANLALLRSLSSEEWERPSYREKLGAMTLGELVVMMTAHDGYHLQQIMAWLKPA